jgi:hypothetical protein
MSLQQLLTRALPGGVYYGDAAQLCQRLYCTIDGIPTELGPECTKEGLASAFASLAQAGWVTGVPDTVGQQAFAPQHWLGVIRLVLQTEGGVDFGRGDQVLKRVLSNHAANSSRDV